MRRAADPPQPPRLPPDLERGSIRALADDDDHADLELADATLVDQHAKGVRFEAVRLTGTDLSGSRLERFSVTDGVLEGCNLSNLNTNGADLTRIDLDTCRLTGIVVPDAVLRDITFRSCRVDLVSFSFSRLERVTFEDCLLVQADFLEARLESVRFHGCDLGRADFRGARLQQCEFRRNELTGIQGADSLRGAAMEWPDIVETAGLWAAAAGIEVIEDA